MFAVKKKLKNDVAAFPRLNLYCSKSLLSGRPGFDSQPTQNLGTHSFEAPWPKLAKSASIKDPINIYMEPEAQRRGMIFMAIFIRSKYHDFIS